MINNTAVDNKHPTKADIDTVYPITFSGATDSGGLPMFKVTLTYADGSSKELEYNVDYKLVYDDIQENNNESFNKPHLNGIKFLLPEYAVDGNTLYILRTTPFEQPVDFQIGRIDPEQIEKIADLSVLRDQEIRNQADKDRGLIEECQQGIATNAADIQKVREDFVAEDDKINQKLNKHSEDISDLRDNLDTANAAISKNAADIQNNRKSIDTNAADISSLRSDMNAADAVLRENINANAVKISGKQNKLVAGDNIIISGDVISATGAGGGAGLDMVVVDQLPETGQKGILYLVKKDGAAPDIHDEYVWIESTQSFELIGTTAVDLSGYAKKTYVDSADQQLKVNQDSLYANQVVLSGMLNTKDADGNWTTLTTMAQTAIPAINELNEKIESAGDASLPEQADIENSKFYNIPLFDGTKLLINNSLRFRWFEHQNGGALSFSKTNTSLGSGSLCVGINSVISGYTGQTAIGHHAKTSAAGATAIGWAQVSAECAVHIGSNYLSATNVPDNSVRGSFMWTNNDGSYLLFNRDGTIPADRMSATAGTTGQILTKTDTGMAWQDQCQDGLGKTLPAQNYHKQHSVTSVLHGFSDWCVLCSLRLVWHG